MRRVTGVLPNRERETGRAIHGINALFAAARRGQAPKPAPAGAPKAQGLTALCRRGTIDDAVNRDRRLPNATGSRSDALLQRGHGGLLALVAEPTQRRRRGYRPANFPLASLVGSPFAGAGWQVGHRYLQAGLVGKTLQLAFP